MFEFKQVTLSGSFIDEYWDGKINFLARQYAYVERGLSLANQGKYLAALFGLGVFKSDVVIEGWMLIAGGILTFPLLALIGRWHMFRVSKAQQVLTSKHESLLGFQGHNMQVLSTALLYAIAEKQ